MAMTSSHAGYESGPPRPELVTTASASSAKYNSVHAKQASSVTIAMNKVCLMMNPIMDIGG